MSVGYQPLVLSLISGVPFSAALALPPNLLQSRWSAALEARDPRVGIPPDSAAAAPWHEAREHVPPRDPAFGGNL